MRADRLISIVMLLQTHERMTAEELADELEVSPRTVYRDITALNIAGIPVYTDRGPGGGIALVDSYKTTLTGMKEDEARALFMMSIPESLVQLGVGQNLKSAWLKLAVALPPNQQRVQLATQQRIYLDSTPWKQTDETVPQISVLHSAVWENKEVNIIYQGSFETKIELDIEPYGLVSKLNEWYLVGKNLGYLRVIEVADILQVEILDHSFARDENFDLIAFWKEWCRSSQELRQVYTVILRMSPELLSRLSFYLGDRATYTLMEDDRGEDDGWKIVSIQYDNYFHARGSILNFGRAAEVLEPEALKLGVLDFAKQIQGLYQRRQSRK